MSKNQILFIMKSFQIVSTFVMLIFFTSFTNAQKNKTIIKGKVHQWPSDTIYIQTLPFYSPYSSELKHTLISKDSTFSYEFTKTNIPIVFHLSPNKELMKVNSKKLLFENLTKEHYWGFCNKFYDYGLSTHLIEKGNSIYVNLTYNSRRQRLTVKQEKTAKKYGIKVAPDHTVLVNQKTEIKHFGSNKFEHDYYQKSFTLDDIFDKRLEIYESKSIVTSVESLKKLTKKLLGKLEKEKEKLSPLFYNYIRAEIVFGAKKEFLKFLRFSKPEELKTLFSKPIPKEILDVVEFEKSDINNATLISEEYNEYLELYVNFKMNVINKKYIAYNEFSEQKIKTVIKVLPKKSVYYYLTNHLLHYSNTDLLKFFKIDNNIDKEILLEELVTGIIKHYPNGELNGYLFKKFDL